MNKGDKSNLDCQMTDGSKGSLSRRDFLKASSLGTGLAITSASAALTATGPMGPTAQEATTPGTDDSKGGGWYQRLYLRAHFDIGFMDVASETFSKLNIEDIVATIYDAGCHLLSFYIQGQEGWLYYPSETGLQHPKLHGRDAIGECVAACHRRGMKFLGYYVPFEWGHVSEIHPEWRMEYIGDPVPAGPRLYGSLCFNQPGCWDFILGVLRESVSKYDMDIIWFDNFWRHHCGCGSCLMRYRKETGLEMPRDFSGPANVWILKDPERPEVGLYLSHMQKWVNQWAMELTQTVKKIRPDCVVEFQLGIDGGSFGYTTGVAEIGDFISSDCVGMAYQYDHSYRLKYLRGFSRNNSFEGEITNGEHHADEVSPKEEGLLRQHFAYVLATGGVVMTLDDMWLDGSISKKKYQRVKKVNAWAQERFPYLGGEMVADVGVYTSLESMPYYAKYRHWDWGDERNDAGNGSIHQWGSMAFVQAMVREKVPFDLVFRHKLEELGRHRVIYMSNVEVLSEPEGKALREFVKSGGGLVLTYRTGLRDERLQERKNFLLAEVMGADYLETPDLTSSHIVVGEKDRAEGFFSRVDGDIPYFEVHGPQCYVQPRQGTRWLGKVGRARRPHYEDAWGPVPGMAPSKQLYDPQEIRQPAVELYFPEVVTNHPAVVLNSYGKGRVAYGAAYPHYDHIDDLHDLMMALVNWAAGGRLDATVTSNAPGPVEIISLEQAEKKRTVLHALNWQSTWPGVAAHNVEVGIKAGSRKARRAYAIEAKREVTIERDSERIHMTIPPVEVWETVVVEWE
jgi:hypothetical protein